MYAAMEFDFILSPGVQPEMQQKRATAPFGHDGIFLERAGRIAKSDPIMNQMAANLNQGELLLSHYFNKSLYFQSLEMWPNSCFKKFDIRAGPRQMYKPKLH
jgi:hypothetical protein